MLMLSDAGRGVANSFSVHDANVGLRGFES